MKKGISLSESEVAYMAFIITVPVGNIILFFMFPNLWPEWLQELW